MDDGKLDALGQTIVSALPGVATTHSVAFNQLMVRWREDATKIVSALNEFEQNLLSSQTTYTATDDTQQTTFSRLSGRLG